MENKITFKKQGDVAEIRLTNPEKHNAFDDQFIADFTDLLTNIKADESLRVVVIKADGKSFSAGADLNWMKRMAQYSYEQNLADAAALAKMLHLLNYLPQTTIALVNGAAFGGGVGIVSCCDIVLATEKAKFCLSEVKIGLIPATISPYVIDAIGQRASRRYFQTAEVISAQQALSLGLVSELLDAEVLEQRAFELIDTLLANGPEAVKAAKALIFNVDGTVDDDKALATSEQIASIRVSKQGQEGLTAFFERRPANWQKEHKED
ncbi:enoyl-CoA hydratase/isomerase family protein [Thalassotalea agarivorans]|uniref:Methylglutaconyl-CoA hydratase n=1 Tax=Thalassotalea agarivorans TaxID=349064 RepID=A0A1I0HZH1_THASX|nr:enoyl-CoA hydratase/isomerase family protein [Thalassotalea agarivorans]SET89738.1 methylglutaconyl-CoA hydratase [Thalassotalea agarivorans]